MSYNLIKKINIELKGESNLDRKDLEQLIIGELYSGLNYCANKNPKLNSLKDNDMMLMKSYIDQHENKFNIFIEYNSSDDIEFSLSYPFLIALGEITKFFNKIEIVSIRINPRLEPIVGLKGIRKIIGSDKSLIGCVLRPNIVIDYNKFMNQLRKYIDRGFNYIKEDEMGIYMPKNLEKKFSLINKLYDEGIIYVPKIGNIDFLKELELAIKYDLKVILYTPLLSGIESIQIFKTYGLGIHMHRIGFNFFTRNDNIRISPKLLLEIFMDMGVDLIHVGNPEIYEYSSELIEKANKYNIVPVITGYSLKEVNKLVKDRKSINNLYIVTCKN